MTTDAQQRCALYPESGFFAAVYGKRLGQAAGMEPFTEEVLRRNTFETQGPGIPAHIRAECAVGMWQEFLGGWMPTSFSGPYCDGVRKRWSALKQGGASPAGGQGSSSGVGLGSTPAADGSWQRQRSAQRRWRCDGCRGHAQAAQEFQRTIPSPCAIDIVGDTLGVPSAVP